MDLGASTVLTLVSVAKTRDTMLKILRVPSAIGSVLTTALVKAQSC